MKSSFPPVPAVRPVVACGIVAAVLAASVSFGQVPDAPAPAGGFGAPPPPSAPASKPPASSAPGATPNSSFLGKDVPSFDPGTDMLTWDGKNWNVNNNRVFAARFEKYLNSPEATSTEDRQYQGIISDILGRLAPGAATKENVDQAFRQLMRASSYDTDARLCDSLADAVYTVWSAQRQQQRLVVANDAMQYEAKAMQAQAAFQSKAVKAGSDAGGLNDRRTSPGRNQPAGQSGGGSQSSSGAAADLKGGALESNDWQSRRLVELLARQKANDVKRELSEIQAKIEYQALIVQFFLQRRFQHVLMATRFYRAIFADGDSKLNVGNETKDLFTKSTGFAPTVNTLDSLANEAIRDVREGVKSFDFLLERDELESASKRLGESFMVGEFMPEIRTLSRDKKRRCVEFVHKSNELIAKMEMKDFGGADKLLTEMRPIAKDFDPTRPKTIIETARNASRLHLAKARNAAVSGDRDTLEKELTSAAEIWPTNPELMEVSQKIFDQGDVLQRALSELDQLIQQKNYRRIAEDAGRYMAAASQYPEREKQLKEVLENIKKIDTAVMRAEEMRRQSNSAGAWESVERAAKDFPDDSKLNQLRADLTTQAADFVRTLRSAQDSEKRNDLGASISHYLQAQKLYPASDYATEGIDRLKKAILPEN